MWGQVSDTFSKRTPSRIIPTRVGTSVVGNIPIHIEKDHPHACGDKDMKVTEAFEMFRIIPTRVGTRLKKSRKIAVLQNQPLRFPLTFHRSFV